MGSTAGYAQSTVGLQQTAERPLSSVGQAESDLGQERSNPATTMPVDSLSLGDAVALARKNNPAVLQSEAKRWAAESALRAARRSRFPAVEAREVAIRTDSPADAFGLQLMQERFSFQSFMVTDPNDPATLNNFTTELEASMPLFTGGRLSGGIRQAAQMAEAASSVQEHTVSAVVLGVTGAYLNAELADSAAALARKARDTTRKHVEQAQAFFESGMMVESDLLQAKVQLARMEEGVITAENNARLARAGLNRALGLDQARQWRLQPVPPAPGLPAGSLSEAVRLGLMQRADLDAARRGLGAAEAGIAVAWGAMLPELGISAKVSWNDEQLFGTSGSSTTLMAAARWRIWDWGAGLAGLSRSRAERTAAREAERDMEQQIEFEVRQAWQGVEEARARSQVAAQAVESAERSLSILEERFSQGVTRVTEVLDAETVLQEARLRDLQARFDLQRAVRTLHFATGQTPVPEVTS